MIRFIVMAVAGVLAYNMLSPEWQGRINDAAYTVQITTVKVLNGAANLVSRI